MEYVPLFYSCDFKLKTYFSLLNGCNYYNAVTPVRLEPAAPGLKPSTLTLSDCVSIKKPVFGVSHKVRFKHACSATKTSKKIEILPITSLDMILSNYKRITNALIKLYRCAGWSASLLFANPEDRFSCVEANIAFTTF